MSDEFRQQIREMRRNATDAEQRLWILLRSRALQKYKFRRQHPIGEFVADFCCLQKRLVIEVDGAVHRTQTADDAKRTSLLKERGYEVLRFWNQEVIECPNDVLAKISDALETIRRQVTKKRVGMYSWPLPSPYSRERGRGEGGQ